MADRHPARCKSSAPSVALEPNRFQIYGAGETQQIEVLLDEETVQGFRASSSVQHVVVGV